MKKTVSTLRKTAIFIAGISVVIIGIILLPLPGPGMLVIVAGLIILSSEFDWARRYKEKGQKKLKDLYEKSKNKSEK